MSKFNDFANSYENHGFVPADAFLDQDKELPTRMVSIYEIAFNPLNAQGDTDDELNEFAEVIHEEGQIRSPLNVYRINGENGKKYMLLGGDRRLHALLINAEKYEDSQLNVPVIIEKKPESGIEEELKILELNEHRALTPEREKILVGRYLKIYRQMEKEGNKPSGQVRKWIGSKMNIGEHKAEKYIHEIEGYQRKPKNDEIAEKREQQSKKDEKREELTSSDKDHLQTIQENMMKFLNDKVKINPKNGAITIYPDKDYGIIEGVHTVISNLGFDTEGNSLRG